MVNEAKCFKNENKYKCFIKIFFLKLGTRLKIISVQRNYIESQILHGKQKGSTYFIPRINLISGGKENNNFNLTIIIDVVNIL